MCFSQRERTQIYVQINSKFLGGKVKLSDVPQLDPRYINTWTFQFGCQMVPLHGFKSQTFRVQLAPLGREGVLTSY